MDSLAGNSAQRLIQKVYWILSNFTALDFRWNFTQNKDVKIFRKVVYLTLCEMCKENRCHVCLMFYFPDQLMDFTWIWHGKTVPKKLLGTFNSISYGYIMWFIFYNVGFLKNHICSLLSLNNIYICQTCIIFKAVQWHESQISRIKLKWRTHNARSEYVSYNTDLIFIYNFNLRLVLLFILNKIQWNI